MTSSSTATALHLVDSFIKFDRFTQAVENNDMPSAGVLTNYDRWSLKVHDAILACLQKEDDAALSRAIQMLAARSDVLATGLSHRIDHAQKQQCAVDGLTKVFSQLFHAQIVFAAPMDSPTLDSATVDALRAACLAAFPEFDPGTMQFHVDARLWHPAEVNAKTPSQRYRANALPASLPTAAATAHAQTEASRIWYLTCWRVVTLDPAKASLPDAAELFAGCWYDPEQYQFDRINTTQGSDDPEGDAKKAIEASLAAAFGTSLVIGHLGPQTEHQTPSTTLARDLDVLLAVESQIGPRDRHEALWGSETYHDSQGDGSSIEVRIALWDDSGKVRAAITVPAPNVAGSAGHQLNLGFWVMDRVGAITQQSQGQLAAEADQHPAGWYLTAKGWQFVGAGESHS